MDAIYSEGSTAPCPRSFNMAEYVLSHAGADPEKSALEIVEGAARACWTYGDLRTEVLATAARLLALGCTSGDRVLMRIGNRVEFPILFLGAIAAGVVPVPSSAQLTEEEVTAIAAVVEPRIIIAETGVSRPSGDRWRVRELGEFTTKVAAPLADFDRGDPNRPAYIIFTSGTAGKPRGVVHGHRAIWARRMMYDGWYGIGACDRILHAGAFNWTYTLGTGLMDPWANGATAVIPAFGTSTTDLGTLLQQHQATIFAAAPGVYRQMLRQPLPSLPDLRHGLSAGEKMPDTVRRDWKAATSREIYEAFGMSECSTFISSSPAHPAPAHSIGRPQPGRRVAILNGTQIAGIGDAGVIAIHRDDPGLMLGYLDDAAATAAKYHDDWFVTGDMGAMARDYSVTYLGRDDDMMNAGGYRVSPLEVETAMRQHAAIQDCAAIEVAVRSGAHIIALCYTAKHPIDDADIGAHASQHLARYKQPRVFRRVDDLPQSANGKVMRRTLRDGFNLTAE